MRRAALIRMLIAMTIPLTGTQYEIEAGDYGATVTELGAGLRGLRFGDTYLVTSFDAKDHQLALSEPALGNAIHGLTRWVPWTRTAHDQGEVTLRCLPHGQQGYPFAVQTDVTYRVDAESGLHVTVTATNKGSRPAPWGTGAHPYLTAGAPSIDECELELPAARWLPVDDQLIPSGPAQDVSGTGFDLRTARKLAGVQLDHAFTSLRRESDGLAWVRLAGGGLTTAMWMDAANGWLQVFTSDPLEEERRRKAVAVEPMTCPPNAFVSGEDLIVLQPRESVTVRWGVRAE
jgi:aldose 1-epimerase